MQKHPFTIYFSSQNYDIQRRQQFNILLSRRTLRSIIYPSSPSSQYPQIYRRLPSCASFIKFQYIFELQAYFESSTIISLSLSSSLGQYQKQYYYRHRNRVIIPDTLKINNIQEASKHKINNLQQLRSPYSLIPKYFLQSIQRLDELLFVIQNMFENQIQSSKQQSISQLLGISQAMGVLKWTKPGVYTNFRLAFHPFISTNVYHWMLANYQIQWHNLFFNLAQDRQFLYHLLTPAAKKDPMVEKMLNILKNKTNKNKDGICFTRIDYYNDQSGQPKLTEYNLYSVGMQSNMEQYQQAKKLHSNDGKYVDSQTIGAFTNVVKELIKVKKMEGMFIFVVHEKFKDQPNFLDQTRFEIKLRQAGIKVVRSTLRQMADMITISKQNNLLFNSQLVSFVYYRTGYQPQQYSFEAGYDPQRSWRVKQQVQLSNAIAIPSIEYELINLKRVQTELNKPQVVHRYLGASEAELLQKTRVKQWQFDSVNTEQLQQLIKQVKLSPSKYILKANRQGGGNNLFGQAALQKLQQSTLQQLRHYIMMQKIDSKTYSNIIFDGSTVIEEQCNYQISRYGVLTWIDGKINSNYAAGFLIRAKPTKYDEGGIMAGIGAIVPWKIQQLK